MNNAGGNGDLTASDPNALTRPLNAYDQGGKLVNGAGGDWWNNPNFGAPPDPYKSNPWTGGAAPTYTPYSGAAPTFTAPTAATEQNDPGYQFRMDQGNQALNRRAAANGSLLSGGTLKALARYNQDYASNEFQNVYNRAQGDFSAQNQTYQNNVAAPQAAFSAANTTYGNQYAQYLNSNSQALSDWQNNALAKRTAENDYWTRLQGVSGAGLGAGTQGQGA
jgi:hypothetical protein